MCAEEQPIVSFLDWLPTYATLCETRSALSDLGVTSDRLFVVESPLAPPSVSREEEAPEVVLLLSTSEKQYVSWARKRAVHKVRKKILERYTDQSHHSADPDDAAESVSSISSAGRDGGAVKECTHAAAASGGALQQRGPHQLDNRGVSDNKGVLGFG